MLNETVGCSLFIFSHVESLNMQGVIYDYNIKSVNVKKRAQFPPLLEGST